MAKKIVGIYMITCTANGKRYVGQSIDIKRRFNLITQEIPRVYKRREELRLTALLSTCILNKLKK